MKTNIEKPAYYDDEWDREVREYLFTDMEHLFNADKDVLSALDLPYGFAEDCVPSYLVIRDVCVNSIFESLEDIYGCVYEGEYALTPGEERRFLD